MRIYIERKGDLASIELVENTLDILETYGSPKCGVFM